MREISRFYCGTFHRRGTKKSADKIILSAAANIQLNKLLSNGRRNCN